MRTLFWIALSNFVFPVIFDVALVILAFTDSDFTHGSALISAHTYISILGVLFSTIWASGTGRAGENTGEVSGATPHSGHPRRQGKGKGPYTEAASRPNNTFALFVFSETGSELSEG